MRLLATLIFLAVCASSAALGETRVAFVVGNSKYQAATALENPGRDARSIAETLRGLDFKVDLRTDLTRDGFARALSAFLKENAEADVTFFYFGGHGMQFDGRNYLLATDARLETELDIAGETIALDTVVELLKRNSKAALVFIDACRDNPLANRFYAQNLPLTRGQATRGLAPVQTSYEGAMLVFAASPGQVAYDGGANGSPFATALAAHLPSANIEVLSLMKRVIRDVKVATQGFQTPIVTNDLTREIYLKKAVAVVETPPQPAPPMVVPAAPAVAVVDEREVLEQQKFEAAKWLGTPRAWALYFRDFPNGKLKQEALAEEEKALEWVVRAFVKKPPPVGVFIAADDITTDIARSVDAWYGLTRTDALAVQALLKRAGFYDGAVDGDLGPKSRDAIRVFQAANGLRATGIVTRATGSALGLRAAQRVDELRPVKSSTRPVRQGAKQLEILGEDARVVAASRNYLEYENYTYGLFAGHVYIAVQNDWKATFDILANTVTKTGGHLATITSKEENDFIVELIRYDYSYWSDYRNIWTAGPTIGLVQKKGAREPAGGWEWVTGEPMSYRNWAPEKPNNNEGRANIGEFGHDHVSHPSTGGRHDWGRWDDFYNPRASYIIEIE
ncbi:MAG: caspase family protein [Paracoccaceae bacterium]